MRRDQLFHAVYGALSAQECGICAQVLVGTQRFLDAYMYERINDPWSRSELIDARGFCNAHAWQLTQGFDSASGLTILYHHLLQEFLDAFTRITEQGLVPAGGRRMLSILGNQHSPAAQEVKGWLAPRTLCPACADQRDTEERYTWAAAQALSDDDFRARYESGIGFCFRHLTAVMDQAPSASDLEWLTQAERHIMETLLRDLSEFWRKHDYRFRHEPISPGEATSWKRVLHKYVGAPGLARSGGAANREAHVMERNPRP
jgi:hypothetical protein